MPRRIATKTLAAGFLCFLIVWIGAAVLSVPVAFGWLPAAVAAWLLRKSEAGSIALTALSVLIALGLLEFAVRLLPNTLMSYRPEDRLTLAGAQHYAPNADEGVVEVPHGDLVALAGGGAAAAAEPRRVRFRTDSLGYRNDRDHAGERWIVVGDSFVVGIGTTQDEMLSLALGRRLGQGVYSASFPLEPDGYAAVIRRLEKAIAGDFRAVVLMFEGNDFECGGKRPKFRNWATWVPGDLRRLRAYRVFSGMTGRLQARIVHELGRGPVLLREVAGRPMAFYKYYVDQARRTEPCDWSLYEREIKSVAARIGMLVFVPEKLRLYQPLIAGEAPLPPSPALAFVRRLAADMGVPAVDLTPVLQDAALAGAPEGRFVFWRDDTHWNGAGIEVAARAIAEALRQAGLQ
jgi:hypothetical protein